MKRRKLTKRSLAITMALCIAASSGQTMVFAKEPITLTAMEEKAGAEEESFAYLSDLQMKDYKVGYGDIGIDQGVDSIKTMKLQVEGQLQEFTKGIVAHPSIDQDAYVIWDISKYGATRFTSYGGINYGSDQTGQHRGDVCFEVWVDDQKVWGDEVFYRDNQDAAFIDVKIPEGSRTLKLVTKAGNSMACDHALFAEPKLYVADINARIMNTAPQSSILTVGGSTTMKSQIENIWGNQDFTEDYTISYVTENEDVATVDKDTGVVTAVSGGITKITAYATEKNNGEKLSATAQIEVAQTGWNLKSPDESTSASIILDENGSLHYTVTQNGKTTVNNGHLGIRTSLGDFVAGMTLQGEPKLVAIDENYQVLSGKASTYQNRANELTLNFTVAEGDATFQLVCRSYDDGFAYRYKILSDREQEVVINGEAGSFTLPASSSTISMPNGGGRFSHESTYTMKNAKAVGGKIVLPFMYEIEGTWVLVSEAALNENYTGAVLDASNASFTFGYPQQQGDSVKTKAPFQTPWRFAVMGDITDIMENTMAENLSPAPDESTYHFSEWVKPGVSSWTWLQGGFGVQRNPESIKSYLDLAHEMGWNYFILDEGWQPNNPNYGQPGETKYEGVFDWFPEIVDYAEERGVGLFAWVPCDDLATQEQREERLPYWSELGIKGIKVDFFDRESQDRVALMQEIYRDCAQNRLLVNVHGANKPTGEIRTYPNLLTREAIRGEEFGDNRYDQLTLAPIIRGAIGPSDYTPRITPTGNITYAHQLAIPVLFESGLPCMAGSVNQYKTLTGASFLKNLPAAWDETVGLDTVPGKYITIARRSKDKWYLASNQGEGSREASIPLNFLGDGKYVAEIYTDKESGADVNRTVRLVTKEDTITEFLKQGGACVVRLSPANALNTIDIIESDIVISEHERVQLTLEVEPNSYNAADIVWSVDNEDLAEVTEGLVYAKDDGVVTVTAASAVDGTVYDTCRVAITATESISSQWKVLNQTTALTVNKSDIHQAVIETEKGDFTQSSVPNNKFVMEIPQGDIELKVQVDAEPVHNYQTATLYIGTDDGALFTAQRRYHSHFGGNIFAAPYKRSINDLNEPYVSAQNVGKDFYLKVVKKQGILSAFYSEDDHTWKTIVEDITIDQLNNSDRLQVGVFTCQGTGGENNQSIPVTFKSFTLNGEVIPFVEVKPSYVLWAEPVEQLAVSYGTPVEKLDLPKQVQILVSDNTKQTVDVSWNTSDYQPNQSGTQIITGTLTNLGAVENNNQVNAEISIVVGEKPESVDKEDLKALISYATEAKKTDSYLYLVPKVKALFEKALSDAAAVDNDVTATQAEVDAAYDELLAKVHLLSYSGNAASLRQLVELADGKEEKLYTKDSWTPFAKARDAAHEVLKDENALQAEIDAAYQALDAAMKALVVNPIDTEKLENLIKKASVYEENIGKYTASSAQLFTAALSDARDILASEDFTQEAIDGAYKSLLGAIFGLREIPNKDKLDELIGKVKAMDLSVYSEKTANAVKAAYAYAVSVFEDENADQNRVDVAAAVLEDAVKAANAEVGASDETGHKVASDNAGNKTTNKTSGKTAGNTAAKTGDGANAAVPAAAGLMAILVAVIAWKKKVSQA